VRCWSGPPGFCTPREASRREVPAISWVASQSRWRWTGGAARWPPGCVGRPAGGWGCRCCAAPAGLILVRSGRQTAAACLCPARVAGARRAVPGPRRCSSREPPGCGSPAGNGGRAGGLGGGFLTWASRARQLGGPAPGSGGGVLQLTARNLSPCARPWRSAGGGRLLGPP